MSNNYYSNNYYSNNYVSYGCCNYSNINPKWSQIPYPGQEQAYRGVEPTVGYWPMNYFRYVRNGTIVDNKGQNIKLDIKNPNLIDFYNDLKEVEYVQRNLTDEQAKMAKYWASGAPITTIAPIALQLIKTYNINPPESARIMSELTKGVNDAFIITWYLKYLWDKARPVQLDKN